MSARVDGCQLPAGCAGCARVAGRVPKKIVRSEHRRLDVDFAEIRGSNNDIRGRCNHIVGDHNDVIGNGNSFEGDYNSAQGTGNSAATTGRGNHMNTKPQSWAVFVGLPVGVAVSMAFGLIWGFPAAVVTSLGLDWLVTAASATSADQVVTDSVLYDLAKGAAIVLATWFDLKLGGATACFFVAAWLFSGGSGGSDLICCSRGAVIQRLAAGDQTPPPTRSVVKHALAAPLALAVYFGPPLPVCLGCVVAVFIRAAFFGSRDGSSIVQCCACDSVVDC